MSLLIEAMPNTEPLSILSRHNNRVPPISSNLVAQDGEEKCEILKEIIQPFFRRLFVCLFTKLCKIPPAVFCKHGDKTTAHESGTDQRRRRYLKGCIH